MPYIGQPPVTGDTTSSFRLLDNIASYTLTFDGSSAEVVSTANDTLTFSNHRFVTAQRVTYTHGGGTAIGGLTSGTAYYIIKVDQNTIKLATSAANANNNSAIDLTSLGVGVSHTLNVAFDGINTKFKATYNNGTKAQMSRAGQLLLSINGVIQQPQETSAPTVGFGIDADSTIVFSVAPAVSDVVFGNIIANSIATFDISDNNVDNFTGNGSTLAFTLSKTPANNQNVLVTLDGVVQYPSDTTTTRAYSVTGSTLTFVSAPANGVEIQVRHIGFAGATSSAVTGFYGRTGNAVLTSADDINVQNITGVAATFTGNVSIAGTLTYEDVTNVDSVGLITARSGIIVNTGTATTALVVNGNARVTGILTIGTSSITLDGSTDAIRIGSGVTITSSGIVATSGVTTVSAGSTAAPSITPIGDTNTGIFFPSPDTIAFGEGGAEAARIDSSGRLGIGTANPGNYNSAADNLVVTGSGNEGISIVTGATSYGSIYFAKGTSGADQYRGVLEYNHSNNAMAFFTDAGERVRIDSAGRLLIGTSSAITSFDAQYAKLTVAGNTVSATGDSYLNITRNLAAGSIANNSPIGAIFFTESGGGTYAQIQALCDGTGSTNDYPGRLLFYTCADGASSPTERLRITSAGNVGIGNTVPGSFYPGANDLVVGNTTAEAGITIAGGSSTNSNIYFADGTSGAAAYAGIVRYTHPTDNLSFWTAGQRRVDIDSSGRLLVGTSSVISNNFGGTAGLLQVAKNDYLPIGFFTYSNNAGEAGYCPYVELNRARGTQASPSAVGNGDDLGLINFYGYDGSSFARAATIKAVVDAGVSGAGDMPGRLVFSTTLDGASSPTERMRIRNSGTIWINTGGVQPSSVTTGMEFHSSGYMYAVTSSAPVLYLNRNTSDGSLIEFRRDDSAVGTISVSGGTVSYNPFLGSHWGRLPDNQKTDILVGTILETVNQLIEWKVAVFNIDGEEKFAAYNGSAAVGETVEIEYEGETYEALIQYEEDPTSDLNKHVCVKVNDTAGSKAVFGVFLGWDNDPSKGVIGTWNDMYCAAVGNYFIRMAAGQEPEIGDLVEADGAGCGVVQDDDIIRTKTVAKITSTIPQKTYEDGSFLVTCVLCCG